MVDYLHNPDKAVIDLSFYFKIVQTKILLYDLYG